MSFILHIWQARGPSVMPVDLEDAARMVERLGGAQAKSRAAFKRLGDVLWDRFGPAPGTDPDDAQAHVFAGDPSDWGQDLNAPCPALWNLWINPGRVGDVVPFLTTRATALGLVVLDPQNAILSRPRLCASRSAPPAAPMLRSEVVVTQDKIIGVLYAVPTEAEKFEQAVADTLFPALQEHGFGRGPGSSFERPFPAGKLAITITAEELDEQHTGIEVQVEVTWHLTRRLLAAIPDVEGSYLPGAPSVASPLQMLAFGTPATQALFADRAPGSFTLVVRSQEEAAQRAGQEVIPMLAAVTQEPIPWFESPRALMDVYLHFFLDANQAPAGFEFVCMEDLILARLIGSPLLGQLAQKRIQTEREYAAQVPPLNRWSSAQGLQRVYAHVRSHVQPNPWLCIPESLEMQDMSEAQVLQHLRGLRFSLGIALALNLVCGVFMVGLAFDWPVLGAWIVGLAIVTALVSALSIRHAAKVVYPSRWLGAVLPLTALLPPVHIAVLAYLTWRLRALPGGVQALLVQPG